MKIVLDENEHDALTLLIAQFWPVVAKQAETFLMGEKRTSTK